MKTQKVALVLFTVLMIFALTACTSPFSKTIQKPTAMVETNTVTPTKIPIAVKPTSTSAFPTPQITPRVTTLASNLEQVTDGKLKLSIEEAKKGTCYKPGTWVSLILTYENLTEQPLKIVDYNLISSHVLVGSYGRLNPVLATEQNIQILSREDSMLITVANPNPDILIQVLHPKSAFVVYARYYLSAEFASARNIDSQFQPIPAGHYFLKLDYLAVGYEDSWDGMIGSNRIQICVGN